jgi:hypothetical protein
MCKSDTNLGREGTHLSVSMSSIKTTEETNDEDVNHLENEKEKELVLFYMYSIKMRRQAHEKDGNHKKVERNRIDMNVSMSSIKKRTESITKIPLIEKENERNN